MVQILVHGVNGKMGQAITSLAEENEAVRVVCGVDAYLGVEHVFPVYPTLRDCDENFDVIVDFSNAAALDDLIDFSVEKKKPVVICTTGATKEQIRKIEEASEKIPVFYSANMSLGVNLLIDLVKRAAAALGETYDIEIIEKHHNQKLDAPSGTALAIADSISGIEPAPMEYVYDRHAVRKKRDKREIGISSVRGGNIVGEHEVIFAGMNEVIEIRHQASSRRVFAEGALRAAQFIHGKPCGMYSMKDMIK